MDKTLKVCWTRLPLPLFWVRHYFVLIQHGTEVERIEVFKHWPAEIESKQTNFVIYDYFRPHQGLPIVYTDNSLEQRRRYQVHIDKEFKVSNDQLQDLYSFVNNYHFKNQYHYWSGPNSNTFIQKLLNHLKLDYQLPAQAIGSKFT